MKTVLKAVARAAPRRRCRSLDAWAPPFAGLLGFAHRAHGQLALRARDAIEDQRAIEMVDLVLDHARLEPLCLDLERLAGLVLAAYSHLGGALDLDVHAGEAETALLGDLQLLAGPLEHGIYERGERVVEVGFVDEHSVQRPELGGGEPDPERVVHQLPHARNLGG